MTRVLPKGFGGVAKQPGNRTNPYMVRIKVGTTVNKEKGTAYPKYKIIGYTKTKKDGILMLQDYHDNPYDLDQSLTFEAVYEKMFNEFIRDQHPKSTNAYRAAFLALESLHRMPFNDIKVVHLQSAVDQCGKNYPTLRKVKVVINQMYKWAMKYDLCSKDYSRYVDIIRHKNRNPNKMDRNPFTKTDIDIIWTLSDNRYYQIILMLIYTGLRISELLELKKGNINLDEQYFDVVISKTENGIRRVPIADAILPFFKQWYEHSQADTLLCMPDHQPFLYRNYYDSYWRSILEPLDMDYTPHCARHTCISLLVEARVEQTVIKKIVGHRGAMSLTERVYTHLDIGILIEAVNKMYK